MIFSALKIENRTLALLLGIKLILVSCLILFSPLTLSPDEAQYWTWSQHLDWGYYSKPPGIAWQIWLTTHLFGNTVFGVRLGALIIGTLLPLAIYRLAKAANLSEKRCFWSGAAFAFSPLGIYLSFAATTDGGAVLFLIFAMIPFVRALTEKKPPNYLLIALFLFFGALFKWIAFSLWPFALAFDRPRWSLIGGILLSLGALLPSLYWNVSHDFATFKHVTTSLSQATHGNFFDFLGSQIAIVSPIFFALWLMSYRYLFREKNRSLLFFGMVPLLFVVALGFSFFKKMQPNWIVFLYPPAFVLVALHALPKRETWLKTGCLLSSVLFVIPFLPLPYEYNSCRQLLGWNHLKTVLEKIGYNPEEEFLFGDKYQTTSLLNFYSPRHCAYFFNISDSRRNQFSYWPQMDECERGKTGYFIVLERGSNYNWYENHYCERLSSYFKAVEYLGVYPLAKNGKAALIFKCIEYSGDEPHPKQKW